MCHVSGDVSTRDVKKIRTHRYLRIKSATDKK